MVSMQRNELDELLSQARNLNQILSRLTDGSDLGKDADVKVDVKDASIIPKMAMIDNNVYCDQFVIPTKNKYLTQSLFRIFMMDADRRFSRLELAEKVYADYRIHRSSDRMVNSKFHNIVKLISRARYLADEATNANGYRWIEWFPEDVHGWTLYRLTNRYIRERELMLRAAIDPRYGLTNRSVK